MKKTLFLSAAVLVSLFSACDRKPDQASARERRPELKSPSKVDVTRWKQTGLGPRLYGMIIEQESSRISANLYTLEDGNGLVIREREAQGKYFPEQKSIIFPLYNPAQVTVEKWITEGGPHIIVPWDAGASNLTGTLKDPSRTNIYTFSKLESVTPTYTPGVNAGQ